MFVYHSALRDHSTFFIGLEPNTRTLQKISEKIHRKLKNGGIRNALYLRSSIENLPEELSGIAKEVFVFFPWGSLLAAVLGKEKTLTQIHRICAPDARLEVVFSLEFTKDRSEMERLGIVSFSIETLESILLEAYHATGFEAQIHPLANLSEVPTTWARRLAQNKERSFLKLTAHPFAKP
ncbi:hypothetical protein L0222_20080 [bacterium]|nr:hypothetical protein [bacterium]